VLEGGVGGEDGVVRLDDRVGHLGSRVDGELELGLLAVVGREPLEEERTETGTGSSSERVEDEEALKTGTVVGQVSHSVEDGVDEVLSDGVVSSGVCARDRSCISKMLERTDIEGERTGDSQLLAASSFPEIKV
jgi:hypothetical protein